MNHTNTKPKNRFTSYVNDIKAVNGSEDACHVSLEPKLLRGELQVESAPVHMYSPATKITENGGILGLLAVTNFKLTFIPNAPIEDQAAYQDNNFLGKYDVTLNNIDVIYYVNDRKRKKIVPQQNIPSKIEALHVICKNFRFLIFSFKETASNLGFKIASALARFAFPTKQDLSFGYIFKENYYRTVKPTVTMFNTKNDWSRELIRCGATEWQVLCSPSDGENSSLLPCFFVIPKCSNVERYLENAKSFYDCRTAFWVYGYGNASLIRMAELKSSITDTSVENITLELIRKCDPEKKELKILNLSDILPSVQDVQRGYMKFRELCTPDTPHKFLVQDAKYYSLLEKTSWLFYVSLCLKCSNEVAENLRADTTVVLRENNARDMCCVISSLSQILLDPHFRTIDGFQSLIQKDWVALEHPFVERLGHVYNGSSEEQSPLLLLFLDCVWQLLQQFPEEFEFSQTYLTTVWDSAFLPIFDTFQFNTEYERSQATKDSQLILRPVWDWNEQFMEKDKVFFTNPFFVKKQENYRKSIALPPNAVLLPGFEKKQSRFTLDPAQMNKSSIPKDRYLQPKCHIANLEVWQQCYHRWIPILEIKNGGFPQIELFHRLILSNISKLQRCIETGDYEDLPNELRDITPTNSPIRPYNMPAINSFFPFSTNTTDTSNLTDILTSSNELLMEGSIMDRLSIAQLPD
uniref:Putative myotubularin-related protein 10-b n=1 Tax=Tabanus bromius TaxID=304241 RepID=A0A0K8TME0_TABBR